MEKGLYAGDSGILLAPALQQGKRAGQDSGPHWKARDGKYRSHDHAAGRGRGVLNRQIEKGKVQMQKAKFFVFQFTLCILSWLLLPSLAPAYALEKVRVGLSVRNVVFLPFYYAQDRRIYQKHGLEVELIQMRSDLQTVGVVSGEIDYYPAIGPAILAVQSGMPLGAVVVFYRAPLFSLVSQSQLGSPKELEGKKVAVSRIGSDSHRYAVLMLERSGVDAKKVTFIQTGNTAVSLTALQQVSVEAAVLSPPFTGQMAQKGFKVLAKSRNLIESPWLGLVTSRQKIQRQSAQVKSMIRAVSETLGEILRERARVISYIRDSFSVSEPIATEAYEEIRGVILANLMMPENRLQEYLEGAHRRGELNRMLQVNEVFDYSLLKEIQ